MAETVKKNKKVKIYIPYVRGEDPALFVGVNGETYLIKRGEYVEVPEYVAEVVSHSETEARLADEYIRNNVSDFSEKLKKI